MEKAQEAPNPVLLVFLDTDLVKTFNQGKPHWNVTGTNPRQSKICPIASPDCQVKHLLLSQSNMAYSEM